MVKFASKQIVKFFQYSLSVYTQSLSAFYHPWTVTHQALLFMGFPGQEYWNGLPFPPPGNLPGHQEWNLSRLHCRQILFCLKIHQGSPIFTNTLDYLIKTNEDSA